MSSPDPLGVDFYARKATAVARDLLGALVVRQLPEGSIRARIVETEAYSGVDDLASHGRAKPTPRNLPMYGPPGCAYVYLCYGVHWLFNIACEPEGTPAAVLIRGVEPLDGHELIAARRGKVNPREWTNGPARLTQALGIDGTHNTCQLTTPAAGLWLERGAHIPEAQVKRGPRVGLGKRVPEPWYSIDWRYFIADNPHVSKG